MYCKNFLDIILILKMYRRFFFGQKYSMHIQPCLFDVVNPLLCIKNRWVFFLFLSCPTKNSYCTIHTYMPTYNIKKIIIKKLKIGFFSKSYLAFKVVRVWGIYDYYKCKKNKNFRTVSIW